MKWAARSFHKAEKIFFPNRAACAVLLYHRIGPASPAGLPLAVSPEHFEQHLKCLRDYTVLSLENMVKLSSEGWLPKRSVVITLDDGYADNLISAKPLLEKYGMPATVYVTAGMLDRERGFWWDDLERIFIGLVKIPEKLELSIQNTKRIFLTANSGERQQARRELSAILKPLPAVEIESALESICGWAGLPVKTGIEYRTLSTAELCRLATGSLIEIGAHAVNHVVLAGQSLDIQRQEISQSKQKLEAALGRPVKTFAYPYGLPEEHYTKDTARLVREYGFTSACSTARSSVKNHQHDFFQIPRFTVLDWSGEEFSRRLKEFF